MTSIPTQEESNLLFQEYQHGDTAALAELYRRWHEYVTQRIKQSNDFLSSDIEDIASNVWVLIQQHAKKWDIDLSSWYLFLDYRIRYVIASERSKRDRRRKILKEKGYFEVSELPTSMDSENIDQIHLSTTAEPLHNSRTVDSLFYVAPEPSALDHLIDAERQQVLEKAIRVCEFAQITEKILRLRLGGLKIEAIQKRLNLKQTSCVRLHLKRAIADLKEVIDPVTYEVSPIAPKHRRKCEKAEYLQRAGQQLQRCLKAQPLPLEAVARAARLEISELENFIRGKSKPQAPRLKRLASVLGNLVYDIYLPPLPHAKWRKQGQELWRGRVKKGLSLKKLANLSGIHPFVLAQYENGELEMPAAARENLSHLFAKNDP